MTISIRSRRTTAVAASLAVALAGAAAVTSTTASTAAPTAAPAAAPDTVGAIGLTGDNKLTRFQIDAAEHSVVIGAIKGLRGDTRIGGIDFRVQDGELYGVGDKGGIYTLDPTTARATKVSQLSVALEGKSLGVDFNPAADRLRVITGQGQNLRHDLNTDTTTDDGALNYPAPPAPPIPGTGVVAAAYTNNDLDPNTATTLYVLDTKNDQVALQSPANSGQLAATGKLLVDVPGNVGFDLRTIFRGGQASAHLPVAVFRVGGKTGAYTVNVTTGKARLKSTFPAGQRVVDLAATLQS